jgi:hypothetical protein
MRADAAVGSDADRAQEAALGAMRGSLGADELRVQLVDADFRAVVLWAHRDLVTGNFAETYWSEQLIRQVAAMPQPAWTVAEVDWMLDAAAFTQVPWGLAYLAPVAAAEALDDLALASVAQRLAWIADRLHGRHPADQAADNQALERRIWALLDRGGSVLDALPRSLISPGQNLSAADRRNLMDLLVSPGVDGVLRHCETQTKVEPSGRWLSRARDLVAASSRAGEAKRVLLEVFCALEAHAEGISLLAADTETILRGLVWLPADEPDEADTELLARVAVAAARPLPDLPGYPRAPKLAVSAAVALGRRPGELPLTTLARLALTVRNKFLLSRVHSALADLGALRGWSLSEVMEVAVDDHGLDRDGRLLVSVGAYEAVVEVAADKVRLGFRRDGRVLKGVPDGVKSEIGALKARVKEIGKTLAAQRQRIEALFLAERTWQWSEWEQRYLEHPITGAFGRELLWQTVEGMVGRPRRDADGWFLVGLDGELFRGERVRLWHPLHASVEQVGRWRDVVDRQPIKQVYREVYLLTPAEEQTSGYSNRFAAHILRYRQSNALMRVRGWNAPYLGSWDGGGQGEAVKEFADGAWRASFYHDLVENEDRGDWEARYCSTDQVRFARRDGAVWVDAPLVEVPAVVFSEAMRDVDLFVGVTSIAADPGWADRGDDRFTTYWQATTFGELTASAEVRRDALARLLPRLKIADRAELADRFLRVRGNLRSYRIHLGSGNILMEPDNAYLCIVPGRSKTSPVMLPFDDDSMLSVILSKAFLLAADDKITDPSIARQLRR